MGQKTEGALIVALAWIDELQLELTHVIIQRNLARAARDEKSEVIKYLRPELHRCQAELARLREDGIWCPRCGEVFHDEDMANEPAKFWTCPFCWTIQHQACRGPLIESQETRVSS